MGLLLFVLFICLGFAVSPWWFVAAAVIIVLNIALATV